MNPIRILVLDLLVISLAAQLIPSSSSETDMVKLALVDFMKKLTGPSSPAHNNISGWNMTTDPCRNEWHGVRCDTSGSVVGIYLSGFQFSGALDFESLCYVDSLSLLKLPNNTIRGPIPRNIWRCINLSILDLSNNRFAGPIPDSIWSLQNLTLLDLGDNRLSGLIPESVGELPSLTFVDLHDNQLSGPIPESIARSTDRVSGLPLRIFRAENNRLSGPIPGFDFYILSEFNVSNNDLTGPIPAQAASSGSFAADCFMGNPDLCGEPLPYSCPLPLVQSPIPSGLPGRTRLGLVMMVYCSLGVSVFSFLFRFI
ncbi:unnamed protein product [Linum tenue]|uniref:Leucine-rich repeat-containing N-terminal plant-type domain-containing protein n=1 Tax=Linum tenue TaxID=586396 RepID=A0AAV0HYM5_9ROSI|nr:unnamed protein product [Linum tenue]